MIWYMYVAMYFMLRLFTQWLYSIFPCYKQKREAAARLWAAHVILRCCKLWISKTRAARLRRVRERIRHHAATLIQRQWRAYCAAKRGYESSYLKLKMRLQQ